LVLNIKILSEEKKNMGKGRPEKYNRVSSQQKFMLRRLIIKENLSVKQVKLRLILGCRENQH
jgi:predicted transcriptional regulator